MQESLTLSLGQMNIAQDDEETNFSKVSDWTEEAARRGSQMVLFPETWSTGGVSEYAVRSASHVGEGIFTRLSALARQYHIHIVGSIVAKLKDEEYGNVCVHYGKDGSVLGMYTKIHLFSLMNEQEYLVAGDSLTLVDTPWGKIGLSICYDLRFPEIYRAYALAGAKMVCVPACWPHPRMAHWQVLLRARAIENQMYIGACNRVGKEGNTHYFGSSCVIDPWGEALVQENECEALQTLTIPLKTVEEVRAKIPVFTDRKPSAYTISGATITDAKNIVNK